MLTRCLNFYQNIAFLYFFTSGQAMESTDVFFCLPHDNFSHLRVGTYNQPKRFYISHHQNIFLFSYTLPAAVIIFHAGSLKVCWSKIISMLNAISNKFPRSSYFVFIFLGSSLYKTTRNKYCFCTFYIRGTTQTVQNSTQFCGLSIFNKIREKLYIQKAGATCNEVKPLVYGLLKSVHKCFKIDNLFLQIDNLVRFVWSW